MWKNDSYFRFAVNTYVTISKVRNVGIMPFKLRPTIVDYVGFDNILNVMKGNRSFPHRLSTGYPMRCVKGP